MCVGEEEKRCSRHSPPRSRPGSSRVHKQFVYSENESKDSLETVLRSLVRIVSPEKTRCSKDVGRNQAQGETIDVWENYLRLKADNCEFGEQLDAMLRDEIMFGLCEERVKERLLGEPSLTLL